MCKYVMYCVKTSTHKEQGQDAFRAERMTDAEIYLNVLRLPMFAHVGACDPHAKTRSTGSGMCSNVFMKTLATPQSCWHESLLSARTDAVVAVSHDGIFVQTARPLPIGTRVFVEWMRGSSSAPLTAQLDAVVVAANTAFTGFRLFFTAPDVSTQMALRDLVEGRAARLAPEPIDMHDALDERRIRTSPLGSLGVGDVEDVEPDGDEGESSVLDVSFDDVMDVMGPALSLPLVVGKPE
jgi:hypothetical protein